MRLQRTGWIAGPLAGAHRPDPPGTARDGSEFTYTYDLLINDAVGAMYRPETSCRTMAFLDQVADAALGDQRPVPGMAAARNRILKQLEAPAAEADYPNGFDASYGDSCADTQYPRRFETYRAIGKYAERGSQFAPRYWWWECGLRELADRT